jgi:hypothetical protein
MKATATKFLTVLAVCVLTVSSFAEEPASPGEQRYKEFLAAIPLTKEEQAKILFAAEIPDNVSPAGVSYEILNGLTDSVVVGVVLSLSFKDEPAGKETTIDLYGDCGDILPLTSGREHLVFFQADRIAKLNPKISLKEIRVRKLKG